MRRLLAGIMAVLCVAALAIAGEDAPPAEGGQDTNRANQGRQGGRQGRQGQQRDMRNMAQQFDLNMFQQQEPLVNRLIDRMDEGEVPPELQELADETELIRLRMAALESKISEKEQALLDSHELASLLGAYQKAVTDYNDALAKNEEIVKRRENIAALETVREETRDSLATAENRREVFQTMRTQRDSLRLLEEEIAGIIAGDETLQSLLAAQRKAAQAFMEKYRSLLEKDTDYAALKAELEALEKALEELNRAVQKYAEENNLVRRRGG